LEQENVNILFIGDIIGEPGVQGIESHIKNLIHKYKIHFVIANGENLSHGKGLVEKDAKKVFELGVNVLTGGNHTFSKMQSNKYISEEVRILRPVNHHDDVYGRGFQIYPVTVNGTILKVAVINTLGRVYLLTLNCPFRTTDKVVNQIKKETNIIIVDFHGEASAEKIAFGWFMDGKVSAIIGTHTHVQTADERILPEGTAYITDVGMTGAFDGVIGSKKDFSVNRFVYMTPQKQEVATEDIRINAAVICINMNTGKAEKIERIFEPKF
jgi:2',3'-cyclic-nucleotide 2'-phosphodiesterase